MIIQSPDPGRKLQRAYRLQRIPSTTLLEELVPVTIVDDLRSSEFERPCMGYVSVSGVAARFSGVEIQPQQQGLDIIIDEIYAYASQAGRFRLSINTAGISKSNPQLANARFTTVIPGDPSALVRGGDSVAFPGNTIWRIRIDAPPDNWTRIPLPEVVRLSGPGPALSTRIFDIYHDVANTTIDVSVAWRELPTGG